MNEDEGVAERFTQHGGEAAGAAIGAAIGGVDGALLGAGAGALLQEAVSQTFGRLQQRGRHRIQGVVAEAAEHAGLSPKQLLDRLEADPVKRDLLLRVFQAAHDSSQQQRLIGLAQALASGALSDQAREIEWETVFVSALADLEAAHLFVLQRFVTSSAELGLMTPDIPESKNAVLSLNEVQLAYVANPLQDVLDSILGTLQRHGLIAERSGSGGMSFGGGKATRTYEITRFGRRLMQRVRQVSETITTPDWSYESDPP